MENASSPDSGVTPKPLAAEEPAEVIPVGRSGAGFAAAEWLVVFVIGVVLMTFIHAGEASLPAGERGLPGHDSFYHVKMAVMIPEYGLLEKFPWLRFAYFTDEGHDFVSHHYGFHVLLVPFVYASYWLTGDYLAGARWAIATSFGLTLMLFNLLLITGRVRWRWLWLLLFLLMPFQFFTRHAYIRAIDPSLAFMLLIILLMFHRRFVLTGLAVAGYTHLYLGGVIYAPLVVGLYVVSSIVGPRDDREVPWRLIVCSTAGWIVGVLIHPYFGGMGDFLKLQIFGSGLTPDISVGREWKPYEGVWWFAQMSGVVLTVWVIAVCARLRYGQRVGAKELALMLINFVFLALTLKARRFIEYWPLFCLLSAAFLAAPVMDRFANWYDRNFRSEESARGSWAELVIAFVIALGLVMGAHRLSRLSQVEPFLTAWPTWTVLTALYLLVPLAKLWMSGPDDESGRLARLMRLRPAPLRTGRFVVALRVLAVGVAFLAGTVCFAAYSWSEVQRTARCGYDLPAIQDAMAFLKNRSEPGDVVFTDDWDIFPVYFFHNSHNHYIVGLDPKFTHARRPELWKRYVKVSRGQVPANVYVEAPDESGALSHRQIRVRLEDIRDRFGARYVITDRDHQALAAKLARAEHFAELIYPSSLYEASRTAPYLIFRVRDADAMQVNGPAASSLPPERPNVLHLSLLRPKSVTQGWGDFVADQSVEGGPIHLGDRVYDRGLGTHAPSRLVYAIPEGYDAFESWVGVNRSVGGEGSIVATVRLDGELVFMTDVLTGMSDPAKVHVPLGNARELVLEADPTDDGKRFDHVDWAEACLVRDLVRD